MKPIERVRNAIAGKPVDKPPVWMMRQAGRTLPEYREFRQRHSFWEICRTPDLATEVTLQPIRRFGMDVAVIFSDILVVPDAMGMEVEFTPRLALAPPVRTAEDVARLGHPDVVTALGYVADTIRQVRRETGDAIGVMGFSGAPYTLASYMVEGGSSKHFHVLKELMYRDGPVFAALMDKVTAVVIDYLRMQAEAGATAVQIFDTWAAELGPADFRHFVLPYVARIVEGLKSTGCPVVYYINGIGNLLEPAAETGAGILGIDWRVDLAEVRRRIGADRIVQGNLDPGILFAPAATIRERVFNLLDQTGGVGHIVNLGHGVIPETPLEGIGAFIRSVGEWAEERNHD